MSKYLMDSRGSGVEATDARYQPAGTAQWLGAPRAIWPIVAILAAIILLTPQQLQSQSSLGAGDRERIAAPAAALSPGDAVRIVVWRRPEMSGEFEVGVDGTVIHPLYQDVSVADMPLRSVRERLQDFLARFEANPQFVVEPLLRITVAGEVRSPNLYNFPHGTTLANAIIRAGGPTERGRLDQVRVMRNGSETLVDLRNPQTRQAQMLIQSGDHLVIPRRTSVFRDYVLPTATVTGAIFSVINAVQRATR